MKDYSNQRKMLWMYCKAATEVEHKKTSVNNAVFFLKTFNEFNILSKKQQRRLEKLKSLGLHQTEFPVLGN